MIELRASVASDKVSSDTIIWVLMKMRPPTAKEVGVAILIAQGDDIIVIDGNLFD